jgi:CheY-like chemotaxis protein
VFGQLQDLPVGQTHRIAGFFSLPYTFASSIGSGISMQTILVVDDEDAIRGLIKTTLEMAGYTVRGACNGKEASQLLEQFMPDLLITDLLMPEKEGIELIQEVRARYPKMPIIAISGAQTEKTGLYLKVAGSLGADYTLSKPFALKDLLQTVKQVLDQ